MSQPRKKKEKENKNPPPGPTYQPPLPSLLSVPLGAARTRRSPPPVNLDFRATCRSSSRAVPTPPSSQRLKTPPRARSPQTLTLPVPRIPIDAARPSSVGRRRIAVSGEALADSLHGKLLLPLLLRFQRSPGLLVRCAGPPPLASTRSRLAPSRRLLVAAPGLRRRRSPSPRTHVRARTARRATPWPRPRAGQGACLALTRRVGHEPMGPACQPLGWLCRVRLASSSVFLCAANLQNT